jgi:hypothetical protein
VWQVATGEQIRVVFTNDTDSLYFCVLPGVPRFELHPRPGHEQALRFSLGTPGRYTLACGPLDPVAAVPGQVHGGKGGAAMDAAIFVVR